MLTNAALGQPSPDDDTVWKAFRKWFATRKLSGKPWDLIESYRSELAGENIAKAEIDRRMKVIWRLLWNTPEGVQIFWDKVYGGDSPIYIEKPTALLVNAVAGRKPGKALDFGMGQGRNSVFLALRGWDVTGFDPSGVAVRAAKSNAAKAGVKIHTVISADDRFNFGEAEWDLIVMTYVRDPSARDAHRIWRALKPGGMFVYENGASEDDTVRKTFTRFRILRYENVEGVRDWNPELKGKIERLVAEKPS
ncbi:MAG: class I SAM-dependent methyltransferase [Bryobacteraceae bacterium]